MINSHWHCFSPTRDYKIYPWPDLLRREQKCITYEQFDFSVPTTYSNLGKWPNYVYPDTFFNIIIHHSFHLSARSP